MYVCVCVHIHTNTLYMYVCMHVCIHLYNIHMCVYIYTHVHMQSALESQQHSMTVFPCQGDRRRLGLREWW